MDSNIEGYKEYHPTGAVVISNGTKGIADYAFLGDEAGHYTGLTSVTIPSSVTSIGYGAFYGCSGLTSVVSEIKTPFSFGSMAFNSISNNCTLTVPAGTKAAYIAAGWTEDVFKGGIIDPYIIEPHAWDFTKGLSEETMANLNSDRENWAVNGYDADGNANNWKNIGKPDAYQELKANGVVIPETDGLLFDTGDKKDNSIHLATNKLRLARVGTTITFPNLSNGQTVTIIGRSASTTATSRGIAPISSDLQFMADKSSPQTNGECIFVGREVEGSECTYLFKWKVVTDSPNPVEVKFKTINDGGVDFYLFKIDDNSSSVSEDVTLTAKSYTRQYGEDNPVFEYEVTNGTITSGTPSLSCSATGTSPVGTYDIVIQRGSVTNDGMICFVNGTLTIEKAASTVITAPTAKTLTYTGSAQLLVNAGTASGGTMQYSLDGTSYSVNIPTATDAGTYTVYYKVVGDANHTDTAPATVTVTINATEGAKADLNGD